MQKKDKEKITLTHTIHLLALRIQYGIKNVISNKKALVFCFLVFLIEILILHHSYSSIYSFPTSLERTIPMLQDLKFISIAILIIIINLLVIVCIGTPLQSFLHKRGFQKIGFVNSARLTPVLLAQSKDDGVYHFEYYTNGLPFVKFKDSKEELEAALNLSIVDIYQGKDKTRIIIVARSGSEQLPEMILWNDEYISSNPAQIVLGKTIGGFKVVDLDATPHIQCGGSTGSGKTVLLKCVLHQLYENDVDIYLCDFKGFVDFNNDTRNKYICIETKADLLETLQYLVKEMERRKQLFSSVNCENISKYNATFPNTPIKRIMLASDEIAYAFQKKGLPKEEKEIVDAIESNMTLLAQQGRFAGINLWLSTQRGDADTIPPQIRSNMTIRICGRASEILSRVTIDNSLASEIPIHIKGRFVEDTEEMFQAFYYEGD